VCFSQLSIIMELPVRTNAVTQSRHRALCVSAAVLSCISWGASPALAQGAASSARDGAAMSDTGAMASMSMAMDGGLMNAPHMRMTVLGRPQAGDSARAAAVLVALRAGIAQYTDFHRALADGFHIFAPAIPQHVYHFTSNRHGLEAMIHFDPSAPTSLLALRSQRAGALERGAMARTYELVRAEARRLGALDGEGSGWPPALRRKGVHHDQGSLRRGERPLRQAGIRLDVTRLSKRHGSGRDLGPGRHA